MTKASSHMKVQRGQDEGVKIKTMTGSKMRGSQPRSGDIFGFVTLAGIKTACIVCHAEPGAKHPANEVLSRP